MCSVSKVPALERERKTGIRGQALDTGANPGFSAAGEPFQAFPMDFRLVVVGLHDVPRKRPVEIVIRMQPALRS